METAAAAGIKYLYRYQPFIPERIKQIVLEKKLYFANPKDFNDPWDCRPWYNTACIDSREGLERHIEFYKQVTRAHFSHIGEEEIGRRADSFRSNPAQLRSKIEEISKGVGEAINGQYRVYCLGSRPNCELMWAHYSDKHKGVCFEFGTKNLLFGSALKVDYLRDFQEHDLTSVEAKLNLSALLTKSAAWSYEGEYRAIVQEESAATGRDRIFAKNNFVPLPENALISIISGCLMPEQEFEALKTLIRKSSQAIALKRAVRTPNRYKLSIVPA